MPAPAAPPPAFVQVVEQRLATTHQHVIDWWADDLDGDHVPESIALTCGDTDTGEFIIQQGADLLLLPEPFDGRNRCPDAATTRPAWHALHAGTIAYSQDVHHGAVSQTFAIRDGHLVQLRLHSDSFEVGSDGNTDEIDDVDYEALRWSSSVTPPSHKTTTLAGPLAVVTDEARRPTKIVGATTIAATRDDAHGAIVLHVHADRALTLRTTAAVVHLAPGDSELMIAEGGEAELVIGGATTKLRVQPIDGGEGGGSYPRAAP